MKTNNATNNTNGIDLSAFYQSLSPEAQDVIDEQAKLSVMAKQAQDNLARLHKGEDSVVSRGSLFVPWEAKAEVIQNLMKDATAVEGSHKLHQRVDVVLSPAQEAKVRARIKEIDHLLVAGFVTPRLERKLRTEKARLEKKLLAAASPGTSTGASTGSSTGASTGAGPAGLVSPAEHQRLEARKAEIESLLLRGFFSPEGYARLVAERDAIIRILLAA